MGEYGPATELVTRLIERAGRLSLDEAADLYRGRTGRLVVHGIDADKRALAVARRAAVVAGLEEEYLQARRAATTAFRQALPQRQGPWIIVGHAIANAAGALVVSGVIDDKTFQELYGPWRNAVPGTLLPVGPGLAVTGSGRRR